MTSIYLDDYQLHYVQTDSLRVKVNQGISGLELPTIRQDLYNRPGRHGQTLAHTLYGGRLITLEGTLAGPDTATYRANRQAFIQAVGIQTDSRNLPLLRTLQWSDPDAGDYQVLVATQSLTFKDTYPTFSQWQLQLTAPDWRLLSQTLQSVSLTLPINAGAAWPWSWPVHFGASSGGTATATNSGTAPTDPVITINGPVTNPVISNTTTGEQLALSLTLVAGDVVTIDCGALTVVQGTSTSKMSSLSTGSVFFQLQPGANTLQFAASTFDSGAVMVSFRDAILGL